MEINPKINHLLNSTKSNIDSLIHDLRENLDILNNVDLNEKKDIQRAKEIVKSNLNNYINHIRNLITFLQNIKNQTSFEITIKEINKTIYDFKKNSSMSYQKSTYLVGKEIGDIRDRINNFFIMFKKTLNENSKLIDIFKLINLINSKLNEISFLNKDIEELRNSISTLNNNIKSLKDKKEQINKDIEELKKSSNYKEIKRKKLELKNKKENIKKEIYFIKGLIDFKNLTKRFYKNDTKKKIIDNFKNNFQDSIESNPLLIINLLKEGNLDWENVYQKIKDVEFERKKIEKIKIKDTGINELEEKIKQIKFEIDELEKNKLKKEKKKNKLLQEKESINKFILIELKNSDIEVNY